MKDMLIIPAESGPVDFAVHGTSDSDALLLLQRLYVCQFSDSTSLYRPVSPSLTTLIKSCNTPGRILMDKMLRMSANAAVSMLDSEDRKQIRSYSAYSNDDLQIYGKLTLKSGENVTRTIENE